MDYSKLSDFEINKRVLAIKSGIKPLGYAHNADERSAGIVDVSKNYHWFDFCNNPADAWPIIVANKISLHAPRYKEGWMADFTGSDDDVNDGFNVDYFESHNANPLRAAMIVFLMMQGDE